MNAVLDYRIHYKLNVSRTEDIENSVKQTAVGDPQEIKTGEDFNTFVLGAMAKRSDDGLVPGHVTYKNVLQLAERIRESLVE